VGSTDLDDVSKLISLCRQPLDEVSKVGDENLVDFQHGCDVHDSGEGVVRRLGPVYVIVGVDQLGS